MNNGWQWKWLSAKNPLARYVLKWAFVVSVAGGVVSVAMSASGARPAEGLAQQHQVPLNLISGLDQEFWNAVDFATRQDAGTWAALILTIWLVLEAFRQAAGVAGRNPARSWAIYGCMICAIASWVLVPSIVKLWYGGPGVMI